MSGYFVVIRAELFGNWVNANPDLKVKRSINLSSIQVFFTTLGSGLEIIQSQNRRPKL